MNFKDFDFSQEVLSGLERAKYIKTTPVQEETLKAVTERRDLVTQSQTGTGKTAAFLLASYYLKNKHEDLKDKMVLILLPTRELCDQVHAEATLLGADLGYKVATIYGGVPYTQQRQAISDGIDYLIATPGRVIDFLKNKELNLSQTGILILDEADRMIDMGFISSLEEIMQYLPKKEDRITMLYSATMNSKVGNFSWEYMVNPIEILISPKEVTVDAIEQVLYHIESEKKFSYLLGLLDQEKPTKVILFVNTKKVAFVLYEKLKRHGYKADYISGDQPQKKRSQIIDAVKLGKLPVLIATDVAARGIHIDDVSLVINYDLPTQAENYVHRIGRTARAGNTGKAISLACDKFAFHIMEIEDLLGYKIPSKSVDESLFFPEKKYIKNESTSGTYSSSGARKNTPQVKRGSNMISSVLAGERPPKQNGSGRNFKDKKSLPLPSIGSSLESRMKYYSEKYSETFTERYVYRSKVRKK